MKHVLLPLLLALHVCTTDSSGQGLVPVDVSGGIQSGQIIVSHTALDIGVIGNAFDGLLTNVARSAGVNPMVVTLQFPYTIQLSETGVYCNNTPEYGSWSVEIAGNLTDMDSQTGSYQKLVDMAAYNANVMNTQSVNAAGMVLRLSMKREVGDNYVHLTEWSITATKEAAGAAPEGLEGLGFRTTVHLNWDPYTDFEPVGFHVYRSTASGSYGQPVRTIGAYDNYTDYGLNPGTTYFYKISAFDAEGNQSAFSEEMAVSTNNNNYLKVASLDVLVPVYLGGMEPGEPDDIREGLEFARLFYFRNSKGQLNLKLHFWEIPGYPPPGANGLADFGSIEADLQSKGIQTNQYDAIHVAAYQIYGWFGGATWLGQTMGSMSHRAGYTFDLGHPYTGGDAWVFTHEFGHSLDKLASLSGYDEMLFNHFAWAFPLPPGIQALDAGPNFDGMAQILRLFTHHLEYAAPWDGYIEVLDQDGDGLADDDERLAFDELTFGSSPSTDDSDLDGLTDLQEFYAGIYTASNPLVMDTDGDGEQDGTDPYPLSNFSIICPKTTGTVAINGTMDPSEGWHPMASSPAYTKVPGATLSTFSTWDDDYLYFSFQSNQQLKYYLNMDGSGEDGLFASDIRFQGGNYTAGITENALGDSYFETAVLIIRSDAAQVLLKNVAIAGSQVATSFSGGVYTTEVRIPHNLGPGFGWTYTPPSAPVVGVRDFVNGDIIGIDLVGLPLSEANGNNTDDWRLKNFISLNEPLHYYDMTLSDGPASFCQSKGDFPWHEWIGRVKISTLDNPSGKSQYSDFTDKAVDLAAGNSYSIELTTGYSYFTYDEFYRVWIDLNQNGVFESNEKMAEGVLNRPVDGTPTATLTLPNAVNIPASMQPADGLRMRVSMKRGSYPTPCETFPYGEVEDYTVNVVSGAPKPDLFTNAWELIPTSHYTKCYVTPGQPLFYCGGLVFNGSPAPAGPFNVSVWLSKDLTITPDDILLQTISYTGLDADSYDLVSVTAPVPAYTPPGVYQLIIIVDPENAVDESNEGNNLFTSLQPLQVGAPNIMVLNITDLPAAWPAGSNLSFTANLKNLIAFPLDELDDALNIAVYLSPDNIFGNGNDVNVGDFQIYFNEFDQNNLTSHLVTVPVPAGMTPGLYHILLNTDPTCKSMLTNNPFSGPALNITAGAPAAYCGSEGDFPWHEWISEVKVGNTSHTSGKSQYSDFTGTFFPLTTNGYNHLELHATYSYNTYDEYWSVWIDYNQDNDFTDPDELVFQGVLHASPPGVNVSAYRTANFMVPPSALMGTTRMRVSMKRGAYSSPCENFPLGEVEDYSVGIVQNLIAGTPDETIDDNKPAIRIYPNPASEQAFIDLEDFTGKSAELTIYNQLGMNLLVKQIDRVASPLETIELAGMLDGVYIVKMQVSGEQPATTRLVVRKK